MTITLTPAEARILHRQEPSTQRDGGFQSLLVKLQKQHNQTTNELKLDTRDRERIPRYAFKYRNGGWETRLKGIFRRTLGPDLDADVV